jgi:lipoprotein-releasing system permease protein
MYSIIVCLRYLRKKKITFFAIAGVAVGIMALVVVHAVMSGFDTELRSRIRGTLAHLMVIKGGMYDLVNYDEIMAELKTFEHVEACAPYLEGPALVRIRGAKEFASFRGIDPEAEAEVGDFESYVSKFGKSPADLLQTHKEANISSAFAGVELLRTGPGEPEDSPHSFVRDGEQIVLVTVKGWDRMSVKPFIVWGRFQTNWYEFDRQYIYIPLSAAQELVGVKDAVTGISIKLDDYKYANEVRDRIRQWLGIGYTVLTWEDTRRTFLTAVALEKCLLVIILSLFFFVAGFNIFSIFILIVHEKSKDIGILKALGATAKGIMSIFLLYGLAVGVIGSGIGIGLGITIVYKINWLKEMVYNLTGIEPFPREIYYFKDIPTLISPVFVACVICSAILCSLVFSVYPSIRAARYDPVETLRYE